MSEIPEDLRDMHDFYGDPMTDQHCDNLTVVQLIERIAALTTERDALQTRLDAWQAIEHTAEGKLAEALAINAGLVKALERIVDDPGCKPSLIASLALAAAKEAL